MTTDKAAPRHARFFSAERPFDATKDDHLLDAIQQSIEVMQDCEIGSGFQILPLAGQRVMVVRPDHSAFQGATVRDALVAALNAE